MTTKLTSNTQTITDLQSKITALETKLTALESTVAKNGSASSSTSTTGGT